MPRLTTKKKTAPRLDDILLMATPTKNADLRWFSGFHASDPFPAFSAQGRKVGLLPLLEVGRAKAESDLDEVLNLTEIIADKDLPISGRKVKLAFLNCNGSGSLEVGATEEQVNDTMKMRDSVLKATAQGGRLSYAECQLASDLVATRELNADAFVLMVFCADDLHWLQDLRKSAITRKRPCFILLPESLSPTVRESIVSEAISNGAECVLFWTNVRQLVRNIEFIIGELRLP